MHVAIFHVGKQKRHFSNSVHLYQTLTMKPQRVLNHLEGNAGICISGGRQWNLYAAPTGRHRYGYQLTAIARGPKGSPQISIAIISQTVQLWT
jgi:hypothetical protein